jgi:1-deoxy-D-xylulose-5-phosphate reductoisomerase
MPKRISIWGSTGSIGEQTLNVIGQYQEQFDIVSLTTHSNISLILDQAKKFKPEKVVITGQLLNQNIIHQFQKLDIELFWGREGLMEIVATGKEDLIVNALVGSVGLEATLNAIEANVSIALANKEVLVMAGKIVTDKIKKHNVNLLPIDSEHSAIFQCLQGEKSEQIHRIILTASGGPFLYRDKSKFDLITVEEALNHPNWSMGKKVTIDSATMMNKALEIIEARWLFGLDQSKIEVVIHPQSIIHSMVEFMDGSIKAQMGKPDMRVPISYALTYPERWFGDYGSLDFTQEFNLEFIQPDFEKFPSLQLAYKALEKGGTAPVVLNTADEIAVDLFLSGKIKFTEISKIVEEMLQIHHYISEPDIEDILKTDQWVRNTVLKDFK